MGKPNIVSHNEQDVTIMNTGMHGAMHSSIIADLASPKIVWNICMLSIGTRIGGHIVIVYNQNVHCADEQHCYDYWEHIPLIIWMFYRSITNVILYSIKDIHHSAVFVV